MFLINVVRVLLTKLHPSSAHPAPLGMRKAVRATLILVPLFGLHHVLIPFRPDPGSPLEVVYQIVSAVLVSLQVMYFLSNIYAFLHIYIICLLYLVSIMYVFSHIYKIIKIFIMLLLLLWCLSNSLCLFGSVHRTKNGNNKRGNFFLHYFSSNYINFSMYTIFLVNAR